MIFDLITSVTRTRSWMCSSESGTQVGTQMERIYGHVPNAFSVRLFLSSTVLMGPCNYKLNCIGTFTLRLQHKRGTTSKEIFVVQGLERSLLGRHAAQGLNLLNRVDALSSTETKERIKEKYPNLFIGLGQIKHQEYDIKLTPEVTPFAKLNCNEWNAMESYRE